MARKPIDFYESTTGITCYEDGSSQFEVSIIGEYVYVVSDNSRESILTVFTLEEFDRLMTICSRLRDSVKCQTSKDTPSDRSASLQLLSFYPLDQVHPDH